MSAPTIPVGANIFPDNFSRDFRISLGYGRFWPQRTVSKRSKLANSLKNSLFAGKLAGDGCGHHCVASHALRRSARLPKKREIGPEMPAFRACDFVSGPPFAGHGTANCRKSPAVPADIPVLWRLSAETLVRSRLPPDPTNARFPMQWSTYLIESSNPSRSANIGSQKKPIWREGIKDPLDSCGFPTKRIRVRRSNRCLSVLENRIFSRGFIPPV